MEIQGLARKLNLLDEKMDDINDLLRIKGAHSRTADAR
jgi:hypothetical protein